MSKIAFAAYSAVTVALLITSADLAAAPRGGMGAVMAPPMGTGMPAPMGTGMTAPMDAGKAAAMASPMRPAPAAGAPPNADPPSPDEVLQPDDHVYRPVLLEVRRIVWFEPAQRGLIEAHPLVMGLAAMALATVTLLFFFLHGVKRPKDKEL